MKKQFVTLAVATLLAGTAFAQANDTLAKVKAAGSITMGVRDSSGALSYTLGDGKYVGYHVEICQRIIANVEKAVGKKLEVKYTPVTSQNRIPLTENGTVDIAQPPTMKPVKSKWLSRSPPTWKKFASLCALTLASRLSLS
jgi:glutamate/aspartate transport system substrate-binding protein